jgi:hypothetical protein
MIMFQQMFYEASSFNQTLCWKLAKKPEVKSFQVFCRTEGGKFDKQCVDEEVFYDSKRRCDGWLEEYLAPCIAFFQDARDAWQDLCDFVSECIGTNTTVVERQRK